MTWLFFLQPVALGAKLIDLVAHPVEQDFSRNGGYSGMLKLPDLTAQSLNLTAHALNIGTNEIDIRQVPTPEYREQNKTTPDYSRVEQNGN